MVNFSVIEVVNFWVDEHTVIIGGGQMDETVRKFTGAEAYGEDAMDAVAFAKQSVGVS